MNKEIEKTIMARNILSDDYFNDFKMDLQLFGGGSSGKSAGKIIGAIAVGFLTAGLGFGGAAMGGFWAGGQFSLSAFLMGASLFSAVWTSTHRPELDNNNSTADIQRFDKAQETMSSSGCIPVVYGQRKISGNQTYHKTNAEQNTLYKHVVLCEGGIEGIDSVMANDLIIPTGQQTAGTVFTIQNTKYQDATVSLSNQTLTLTSSGGLHSVYLCKKEDLERGENQYWSYQVSVSSLVSWINMLGEGWQCFPFAGTYKYPGDLSLSGGAGNCYLNPKSFTANVVQGGTTYTFKDSVLPNNYEEVGSYSNMAWLDMMFNVSSELNGNPSISCIVKGKKVKDIRTGQVVYSTNPALCLRDFILSKRYGLGKWFTEDDLDDASWIESANYCDEIISFVNSDGATISAKRYELNMVIDSTRSAMDWLQEILANFCGFLVFSDGKLKLRIEKPTAVSYRFNDSNCKDLKVAPLSLSETPNRYEVSIVDPLNNWSSIKALCEDFADQKTRQKIITKSVSLEGVTSQNQALRLARFYRDYNLVCPLQISFSTGMQGMHLEPGDVVTVSYHDVFENLPIRIAEITETDKGTFEISGRQYNDTIYGDMLGGGIHYYNYTVADVLNEDGDIVLPPSIPSNLTAKSSYRDYVDGTTGYEVSVKFTKPNDANIVRVYYKTKSASAEDVGTFQEGVPADELGYSLNWASAGEGTDNVIIRNAHAGDTYMIRACSVNEGGTSAYTAAIYCVVKPKATIPETPTELSYNFNDNFYFSWQYNGDITEVDYFEIRNNMNYGQDIGLLGRTSSTSINVTLTQRTGVVYLYAVNQQRKYSYPAIVQYSKPAPAAPVVTYTNTLTGALITTGAFPLGVKKVVYYISGNNYSDTVIQESPSYLFEAGADIYTVTARFVDIFGEGELSNETYVTISPTFDGAYIEDGTITADKLDQNTMSDLADIQAIKDDITDLQVEDGQIRTLVTNTATNLGSQITQTDNRVTSIVSTLNGDADGETQYSAITQLNDAIGLKVDKSGVVASINLSSEGVKIDGKYLHVTGTTQFDNNVITNGMLAANAVTANKISSGAVTADKISVSSLSALSATIGTLRTKTTGARVEISDNLIKVYDENNVLRVELGVFS